MTRYAPLWQQAGSYAAVLDRSLIGALWPYGGVTGAVISRIANQMQLGVDPGVAAVPMGAGQGAALCRWDGLEVVSFDQAPPTGNSRIDLLTVLVRDGAIDSGPDNDFILKSVAGSPALSNPVVPVLPARSLRLAQVTVPGGAADLSGATIADYRMPLMSPRVIARNFGPAANVNCGTAATTIIGTGTGGWPNVVTQVGRQYLVRASAGGFQNQAQTGIASLNLFRDGVSLPPPIANVGALSNGQWISGMIQRIENGDGNAHFWQIMGSVSAGNILIGVNQAHIIVEDIGPWPT